MAELKKEIKTFVVQHFAMYCTPTEIVTAVKETFEIEVTRQQVHFYNADLNDKLSKKWRDLFDATRKRFLEDMSSIAIAQKSFRLRELDQMYRNQKNAKVQNTKAMKDTLEQAAKESGDVFSNRHKHEVEGNVNHSVIRVPVKLTPEEWQKQLQSEK